MWRSYLRTFLGIVEVTREEVMGVHVEEGFHEEEDTRRHLACSPVVLAGILQVSEISDRGRR